MSKEALHELIERIDEKEISHVYFFLSLVAQHKKSFAGMVFEEVEPQLDEIEAYEEYKKAKASGEKLYSHEEVWGEKSNTKVA